MFTTFSRLPSEEKENYLSVQIMKIGIEGDNTLSEGALERSQMHKNSRTSLTWCFSLTEAFIIKHVSQWVIF